jgi:hypothetical protein
MENPFPRPLTSVSIAENEGLIREEVIGRAIVEADTRVKGCDLRRYALSSRLPRSTKPCRALITTKLLTIRNANHTPLIQGWDL